MRDPLDLVVRLRRAAVEEAARAMRQAAQAEADAAQNVRRLRDTIAQETAFACGLSADDVAVESFGVWLKAMRQDAVAADAAYERAETTTELARAALTTTRAGTRAAERMLAEREAEQRLEEQRKAQRTLDEVPGPRR